VYESSPLPVEKVEDSVGTSVSAGLLILLAIIKASILVKLLKKLTRILNEEVEENATGFVGYDDFKIEGEGILASV